MRPDLTGQIITLERMLSEAEDNQLQWIRVSDGYPPEKTKIGRWSKTVLTVNVAGNFCLDSYFHAANERSGWFIQRERWHAPVMCWAYLPS